MTSVLLLEDDDDLRATLELALNEVGGAEVVLSCSSMQEVVALRGRVLECSCAILDVNLGRANPSGIDAALWLREHGYTRRIIFLTGHAGAYPQLAEFAKRPNTVVLEKPTPLPRLISLVQEQHS